MLTAKLVLRHLDARALSSVPSLS